MSKDKGTKNHKKAPADKSVGKQKVMSSYKSESKSGQSKVTTLDPFIPKADVLPEKKKKSTEKV